MTHTSEWELILASLAIVFLLALSAFFAGSETALTAASRALMHRLENDGDARAGVINRLRERKEQLISSLLLGNTLVNILASSLATSVLIALVDEGAVALATLGITILVLIFGEVMPKTYCIHHADRMALTVGPLVRTVVLVLTPVTRAINATVALLFRILGARSTDVTVTDYSDELRGAIDLHQGAEEEIREERAMLRSILDLGDVTVAEIMTHRRHVVMVDAGLTEAEIVSQVLQSPYTRIPLWQDEPDNIIGVLHAKDLLRAVQARGGELDRLDIPSIAVKPWFIPDTTTLLDQLRAFRARREHFALVVDEYGTLQGVVTLEDILEEIVGDITDEHDVPVAGVRPQPNGSYVVDGTVTIRDLNRRFEWRLPDAEASTIAGLVLHEARRIPEVGQTFTFYGFRFEILRRQRNQVTLMRLTPPALFDDGGPSI